jgi:hypothetical protein
MYFKHLFVFHNVKGEDYAKARRQEAVAKARVARRTAPGDPAMTRIVFTNRRDRRPHAAATRVSEALADPHYFLLFGLAQTRRPAPRKASTRIRNGIYYAPYPFVLSHDLSKTSVTFLGSCFYRLLQADAAQTAGLSPKA